MNGTIIAVIRVGGDPEFMGTYALVAVLIMVYMRALPLLLILSLCLLLASNVAAIEVIQSADATALANALLGSNPGIVITSSTLDYRSQGASMSCGTYTNASGVFGVSPGIVLSSGDVTRCSDSESRELMSLSYGVLALAEDNALLTQVTLRSTHYDTTRLDIVFDLLPGYDGISMDTVFGSEEYPNYQYTSFNDGLGIFVNDTNIATVDGSFVNISDSHMVATNTVPGTDLCGLNGLFAVNSVPLLTFKKFLGNGAVANHLTIIIGDASDAALDTVAFLGNLSAERVPYGITNLGASHAIISTASTHFNFKVWGTVTILESGVSFTLDDGSGAPVHVVAPGFSGIENGDHATARGKFSGEGSSRVLNARASDVVK